MTWDARHGSRKSGPWERKSGLAHGEFQHRVGGPGSGNRSLAPESQRRSREWALGAEIRSLSTRRVSATGHVQRLLFGASEIVRVDGKDERSRGDPDLPHPRFHSEVSWADDAEKLMMHSIRPVLLD